MHEPPSTGLTRRDWLCLLFLIVATSSIRLWQITHTTVAARDSIGYVRIAWRLEHGDFARVVRHAAQHPLYPALLLTISWPLRAILPYDLPLAMQLSAQLTNALASVALVVPMFLLGRGWFDRRIAVGATLLFQCLPASGRVMGDGLSESLFLLFSVWSIYWAARGLREQRWQHFAWAGVASGLAYLTRPEGLLVGAAAGLVLLLAQFTPMWRRSVASLAASGTALALATMTLAGPYMLLIGGVTVKASALRVIQDGMTRATPPAPLDHRLAYLSAGLPLLADWFENNPDAHAPSERVVWGLVTLVNVVVRGFFWSAWLPALVGLWCYRGRLRHEPGVWLAAVIVAILSFLLYRVAVVVGYMSDRHTLLIILLGCFWSVAGLGGVVAIFAWCCRLALPRSCERIWSNPSLLQMGCLAILCGAPLLRTLEPLHAERAGFRTAGYWLAHNALPGDLIEDAYAWANYYAGHVFTEVDPEDGLPFVPGPAHDPRIRYVVMELSDNKHPRLQVEKPEDLLRQGGEVAQRWRLSNRKDNAEVVVYRVPIEKPTAAAQRKGDDDLRQFSPALARGEGR